MSDTLLEPARDVPVAWRGDLVVVGGSCTGTFAAVRAARMGLSVALIERQGFLGGTATAGLVPVWHSVFNTTASQRIIGGLTQEVLDRLKARDAATFREPTDAAVYAVLNTEELKIELDALCADAGVRVFLHTRFCAPWPAPDAGVPVPPEAVIVEDKTGRRALCAKYFIDASGDGDLLARAGLPTETRPHPQPPTTCVVLAGLDALQARNPGFNLSRAVFDARYPEALPPGFLWTSPMPGLPGATMVAGTRAIGVRVEDADDLTRAEQTTRQQARRIHDLLRRHFDGGDQVRLGGLSPHIGLRESRHAVGLHRLTEMEVLTGAEFPDAVAQGSYRVDIHHNHEGGLTFRYLDGREDRVDPTAAPGEEFRPGRWRAPDNPTPPATFYRIPYRSLLPKGATNVWAAGRLIDADRGAYGAIRVMVLANQTGEAAGVAAALAAGAGLNAADVDPAALRKTMREGGSILADA